LGNPRKALRFAFWCSLASVVGGLLGYAIGYGPFAWIGHRVAALYAREDLLVRLQAEFDQRGVLWVFLAGFTPIPYKIFTIAAGMAKMNLSLFVLASAVSRSARFFLVAALIRYFGRPIKSFIDRYFNLLCLVFGVLLVGGFFVIKYIKGAP
jgi:membrane protein YqaA with SNARE-associated domain